MSAEAKMFEPETEDMLPRAAPRPSAEINEGIDNMKPTVPEVSILFGQQQPQMNANAVTKVGSTATINVATKQTYAAWKKQMLPKVTFAPIGTEAIGYSAATAASINNVQNSECAATPRSNLYPLRAAIRTLATPTFGSNTNNTTKVDFVNNVDAVALQNNQRRSLENVPMYNLATTQKVTTFNRPNNTVLYPFQQQQEQLRRSIDIPAPNNALQRTADVLTICAGTQTDFTSPIKSETSHPSHYLAIKKELEDLHLTVQAMREDQLRLLHICGALLAQQQQLEGNKNCYCRDVGTQCENEPLEQPQALMANGFSNPVVQMQTPSAPPQAQSTAYRANTPRRTQSPNFQYQQQENMIATLPKATTEKSAVMNELALKYLPNEKLNELLEELNIGKPMPLPQQLPLPTTPLRNIENLGPNDISNASYKYLKKYRLLPEEFEVNKQRNEQQPQQSPYQQPVQPLAMGASPNLRAQQQEQMLDLENIRNKPKFL